ncbi:hypothetical protein CsSME_00000819 [Camellia sinensis var. sinensis]
MMRPTEAMMRRSGDSDALACFCVLTQQRSASLRLWKPRSYNLLRGGSGIGDTQRRVASQGERSYGSCEWGMIRSKVLAKTIGVRKLHLVSSWGRACSLEGYMAFKSSFHSDYSSVG